MQAAAATGADYAHRAGSSGVIATGPLLASMTNRRDAARSDKGGARPRDVASVKNKEHPDKSNANG
jgi:hypothetical protein